MRIFTIPKSAVQMRIAGYMRQMKTLEGVLILVYFVVEVALAIDTDASAPKISTLEHKSFCHQIAFET